MKILVSGSLAFDKILDFPGRFSDHILPHKIHDLNVSFVTENLSENFGGTAGNIAFNLALLGAAPVILSSAGDDFQTYQYWLETKGADLSLVQILKDVPTAFATIMTDQGDNQITGLYLGAMNYPLPWTDRQIPSAELAIVAAGNTADMRRLLPLYRRRQTPFIFDPGQQLPALAPEDIRNGMTGAKIFISNDYELSLAMEKTGWREKDILNKAEILITTFGEKGSRILTQSEEIKIPAAETSEVKDPTGAGDAYRAGLAFGVLKKWPLLAAGRFASIIAAYAVENVGPQSQDFTLHSARARYAENFGEELPS